MPAEWQSPSDPTVLPAVLADALRAARATETTTRGPGRRPAYRFTRALLGGIVDVGYSAQAIAPVLDLSVASVRARTDRDQWLPEPRVAQIVGETTLRYWHAQGLLPAERTGPTGETSFPAADVIRALLSPKPQPTPRPPQGRDHESR